MKPKGQKKPPPVNPWHWILDEELLSANEKLVALAIVRRQNGDKVAWPSVGRIAMDASLGTRTVQRTLRDLDRGETIAEPLKDTNV